jgi:hypothetical protein
MSILFKEKALKILALTIFLLHKLLWFAYLCKDYSYLKKFLAYAMQRKSETEPNHTVILEYFGKKKYSIYNFA